MSNILNNISKKLLIIGRAGMDIYPEPPGVKTEDAENFSAHLGGSAANTCVALNQFGIKTDLVTCISDDSIGKFVKKKLEKFQIGIQHCRDVKNEFRTQLAVVETRIENCQSVLYRNNSCDLELSLDDINKINFDQYGAVMISGTALSAEPSRAAVMQAIEISNNKKIPIIIDIDYRPYNWESDQIKSEIYKKALVKIDIIIGNDLEFNIADNADKGLELANQLIKNKPSIIIYKKGELGSELITKEYNKNFGIFPVVPLKPTGAGDAFNGGFISSLLHGDTIDDAVIKGSACAAIVVTKVACSSAMPSEDELKDFMKNNKINEIGK
jgi:5-dehydro-2-deoxygluconokinase